MHLFREKLEQGHFPMHTLMITYTNICLKLTADWKLRDPSSPHSPNYPEGSQSLTRKMWKMSIIQLDMKENNKDLNIFQATVTQRYTSGLAPIMAFKQFADTSRGNIWHGRNRGALYCVQTAGSGFYLRKKRSSDSREALNVEGGVLTGKQSRCWTEQRRPPDFCTFLLTERREVRHRVFWPPCLRRTLWPYSPLGQTLNWSTDAALQVIWVWSLDQARWHEKKWPPHLHSLPFS